ncbi:radical SAM protein [Streptomyces sp. NBC_01408]|uniref:radical SAM protein n=1 Tax=Streptomyces sp. NBC_01408 TaxID=2903855 RepID=UPI002251F4AA|nr:radical SAM protein [Streptomyces sp. NBC_01408]MCX4692890.1 radical SAM protein [Streptomyces sp. NBC_01408]
MPHHLSQIRELFIWPHAGCNHRCVSCDIWQDKSRRELAAEDIERWAQEWEDLGVKEVILTGGEPLMHRDLASVAAPLRERGIPLVLLSTGLLLKKYAQQVVDDYEVVLVSLDGPPGIHDEVRRVGRAYDHLVKGLEAIRELRPDIRVAGRCTVHRYNYRHLAETVRAAQELGFYRFSFIPADVTSEAFNRAGGWDAQKQEDLVIAPHALPELDAELDRMFTECADAFSSGMIQETPDHIRAYVRQFYAAFHQEAEYPPVSCNLPWGSAVIEVDGTVRPCFFQEAYGNIHEAGSLNALINSPTAVKWREELDVATDETCRRCVCFNTIPLPAGVGPQ